jgi:hypothetical protein
MKKIPSELLETISNLARYHREHEKYYAKAPLQQAVDMQHASGVLKTFADRWRVIDPEKPQGSSSYLGCEDLNVTTSIQSHGVLFMEGEGEPPEISRLKRDLSIMADDFEETGKWLSEAMQSSWEVVNSLTQYPLLSSVIGERHRIIVNDWQAANLSTLISRLLTRSVAILKRIDFSPASIRDDLAGVKSFTSYLYSASELIDRAADLATESAALVHDNERRWRVFHLQVESISQLRED